MTVKSRIIDTFNLEWMLMEQTTNQRVRKPLLFPVTP